MSAVAGISGGRTSGYMAYMLAGLLDDVPRADASALFSFQNVGCENAKTYDFVAAIEQDIARPIYRLEFRAPPRGQAPVKASFEIVEHAKLWRRGIRGGPYEDMLECLRTFRAKHNKFNPVDGCGCNNCQRGLPGPIAPWARSRVCTAYMKIRTQRKWCASLGWGHQREYTEYVGLRADEPLRVSRMRERNAKLGTDEVAPLADAGVVKPGILGWWAAKPFDLGLPEHLGNCEDCYLKDEADLATAMVDPERTTDPSDWIWVEATYGPMRRGRSSYAQVMAEAPDRMEIRAAIAAGRAFTVSLDKRRVKLITAQEIERANNGPAPFSCECDAAKADDFEDAA